jgi:hypothetical protein
MIGDPAYLQAASPSNKARPTAGVTAPPAGVTSVGAAQPDPATNRVVIKARSTPTDSIAKNAACVLDSASDMLNPGPLQVSPP